MRSDLDEAMDRVVAGLTAPGGMLATDTIERDGVRLPVIATAPPTVPAYFAHFCAQHAAAEFLVAGDERLTFAEVHDVAARVAHALAGPFGIAKGDRVGIAMRNAPAWIVLYMGVLMAGGVATLLNGWWERDELIEAIDDVDCALLLVDAARARRIEGHGARVVVIDPGLPIEAALAPVLTHAGEARDLPEIGADDLATILFTSGSTGRSKGAVSDHRAVVQGAMNFVTSAVVMLGVVTAAGNPPKHPPSTVLSLPLFHVTAEIAVLLQSFAIGRKLVLMPKWDAVEAMRLMEAERVTYFVGVPLMSFEILTHPERHRFDLSSVADFAAGGAPRPADHVRRIQEEMGGGAPLIGYGLTETNAVGTGNWRTNYLARPTSAGRATAPLVDVAIVDADGAVLPPLAQGEIAIRSVANFREYWNNPAATAAAFTPDRRFRTGDIGYLDEDGYLFIVDRSKDIIIRGGENISCQEVEAALYAHPDIAEAAVFALPDERFGEVPAAAIRLRDGSGADAEALVAWLDGRIAAFKVPRRMWMSPDALPRLGTEKIDKVAIRAHYGALAAAERLRA